MSVDSIWIPTRLNSGDSRSSPKVVQPATSVRATNRPVTVAIQRDRAFRSSSIGIPCSSVGQAPLRAVARNIEAVTRVTPFSLT